MTENKAAARVLEHPNGLECELAKTHKTILLHFVRFGKLFAKTCAVVGSIPTLQYLSYGITEPLKVNVPQSYVSSDEITLAPNTSSLLLKNASPFET